MFLFKTFYPYIGGERIPLNYYSLLYPQLEKAWKNLVEYLDGENIEYRRNLHNLEITVDDDRAVEVLSRIHLSFMDVKGIYHGETIDRRIFHRHLWGKYMPSMIRELKNMIENIRAEKYREAYLSAVTALKTIAETEILHAKTGGVIDRIYFEMLHGNIPQTYTNTYLLVEYGSRSVEKIASQIYSLVVEEASKTIAVLEMNMRMVKHLEDNSAGVEESEED